MHFTETRPRGLGTLNHRGDDRQACPPPPGSDFPRGLSRTHRVPREEASPLPAKGPVRQLSGPVALGESFSADGELIPRLVPAACERAHRTLKMIFKHVSCHKTSQPMKRGPIETGAKPPSASLVAPPFPKNADVPGASS